MAEVTYSALVTPSGGYWFNASSVIITATITGPSALDNTRISFTLQNNVNSTITSAALKAVFATPTWALDAIIQNVTPTFMVSPPGVSAAVAAPMGGVAISTVTLASATSTTPATSKTSTISTTSTTPTASISVTAGATGSLSSTTVAPTSANAITPSASPMDTSSPKPLQGYNGGEVAGAAAGCFMAGLLIASMFALLFFRRRSMSRECISKSGKDSSIVELHGESLVIDAGITKAWERRLPQPDSDRSIAHLASRTLDEIELFVEEFYTCFYTDMSATPSESEFAPELSPFHSPHLQMSLGDLLRNAKTPTVLIKHCIAYFLLQRIDPSCNNAQSLLPREYIIPKSPKASQQECRQAISQLRVLMAHARSNADQDEQYLVQRDQVVGDAIRQIDLAFQPWVRGDPSTRTSALKGVVIHVGELGIKLFSQPASFQWRWGQTSSHAAYDAINRDVDGVIMLPGLDKTTDQKAELLATPICLVKPRRGFYAK